jgi:hypothetical protein
MVMRTPVDGANAGLFYVSELQATTDRLQRENAALQADELGTAQRDARIGTLLGFTRAEIDAAELAIDTSTEQAASDAANSGGGGGGGGAIGRWWGGGGDAADA